MIVGMTELFLSFTYVVAASSNFFPNSSSSAKSFSCPVAGSGRVAFEVQSSLFHCWMLSSLAALQVEGGGDIVSFRYY